MTLADIESDLLDYADFEEVNSVARARSFVTAAKRWLILRADSASSQSQSMSINKPLVENLMKSAKTFIAANASNSNGGGSARFLHIGAFTR